MSLVRHRAAAAAFPAARRHCLPLGGAAAALWRPAAAFGTASVGRRAPPRAPPRPACTADAPVTRRAAPCGCAAAAAASGCQGPATDGEGACTGKAIADAAFDAAMEDSPLVWAPPAMVAKMVGFLVDGEEQMAMHSFPATTKRKDEKIPLPV